MQPQLAPKIRISRCFSYRCEIASDAEARAAAEELTDRIYWIKLGLPKPTAAPSMPECVTLLVRHEQGPVATMTLQSPAFAQRAGARTATTRLELEENYVLETIGTAREELAEVRRMAAEPGHRGAVQCLYAAAAELSLAYGVRHWIGLVEAHGNLSSDVPLVHRILDAHGLLKRPLSLRPRVDSALFDEDLARGDSAFTPEQLKRLPVPQRIRAFARLFQARAVSVPSLHPRYPRVVVPMLATMADVRRQWLP